MITNLEDLIGFDPSVNRALKVMRFSLRSRLKVNPFEQYQGGKTRTELTNTVKDKKNHLFEWNNSNISVLSKQILIYVGLSEWEVANLGGQEEQHSLLLDPQITENEAGHWKLRRYEDF